MINIIKGDITKEETCAIVNAANNSLLGGGGVDGAIHSVAGPELLKECETLNGCETGDAKITKGYNLKAKYVIHTVAPRWYPLNEEKNTLLLKSCYEKSFKLAMENNIKTISFPCLGMGIYQVPLEIGAKVAIDISLKYDYYFDEINLVCFDDEFYDYYNNLIKEYYIDLDNGEYEVLQRDNDTDKVTWINHIDYTGEHLFTFDMKKVYNLFRDYPDKLSEDEKEIFDSENEYWKNYFKDRK